jgi:hypothetical protein
MNADRLTGAPVLVVDLDAILVVTVVPAARGAAGAVPPEAGTVVANPAPPARPVPPVRTSLRDVVGLAGLFPSVIGFTSLL